MNTLQQTQRLPNPCPMLARMQCIHNTRYAIWLRMLCQFWLTDFPPRPQ